MADTPNIPDHDGEHIAPDDTPSHTTDGAPRDPQRRQWLQQSGIAGAGLGAALLWGGEMTAALAQGTPAAPTSTPATQVVPDAPAAPVLAPLAMTNTGTDQIPRKPLGRTGVQVSIIGLGGATLGEAKTYEEAAHIVHEAVDAGVNFMDNAWEYNNHKSEEWMGRALQGRRDKVFLMTKVCTHGRDAKVAMQQLEESLKRLRTDHLDLWQIHEVIYYNDPELHFAPGGVVEALAKAKQQGKVRFTGFTGHKNPQIHLKMLDLADRHDYHFDTVQMPLNPFDATFRSFEQNVLTEANRRGMGALGMKSLGGSGEMIQQGAITVAEALRYAMSLPVATTISGIDSLSVLRQNLGIARGFTPMTATEMQALRDRCTALAADGHLEMYKSTKRYDAAVGREQHGYPSEKELPF